MQVAPLKVLDLNIHSIHPDWIPEKEEGQFWLRSFLEW
jgi:hypothetical protein